MSKRQDPNDDALADGEAVEEAEALPEPTPIRPEPPLEEGVAPNEQNETLGPVDVQMVEVPRPFFRDLTGPELAEIRRRNEAVDRATEDQKAAAETARQRAEAARLLQDGLSRYLTSLIDTTTLDPAYTYQVDLERGQVVPSGPKGG